MEDNIKAWDDKNYFDSCQNAYNFLILAASTSQLSYTDENFSEKMTEAGKMVMAAIDESETAELYDEEVKRENIKLKLEAKKWKTIAETLLSLI